MYEKFEIENLKFEIVEICEFLTFKIENLK